MRASFDSICYSDVAQGLLSLMYVVISVSFSSAQSNTTLEGCCGSDQEVSGFLGALMEFGFVTLEDARFANHSWR